jgi:arylsulfatase A-like enzyme
VFPAESISMFRKLQPCSPLSGITVLFLLVCGTHCQAAARPNIVLIMCDDMGFSDIGCYGGEIATPNIDGLARDGMRFTQFYNNAKCTTTRASLITGLYPRRGGKLLKKNMTTIAEVLRDGGYHTALSGKWHLGSSAPHRPSDRGFNEYYGLLDGCCNFFDPSQPDPEFKGGRVRWFGKNDERIKEFADNFYTTDAFSDYAVDVISRSAVDRKHAPFFLHVCYTAPHYPLHALPEDIEKYRGRYLAGWEALRQTRHERQLKMGLMKPEWRLPAPDAEVTTWDEAKHKDWQDLRMAVYAAMIDRMDQGIGKILASLKVHDLEDNTIVMFLSDNGGCAETPGGNDPARIPGPKEYYTHCGPGWAFAQNTPFRRYKQWVHEGGISTPFIVRYPGVVSANSMTDQVGHIVDLLPTCQALASAEYPTERDGTEILPTEGLDLSPVIRGEPRDGHEWLFWEWSGNRAVRYGQWKLCWDKQIGEWELYDVVADRTETRNLVEEHPDRLVAMSQRWFQWAAETGLKPKRKPSSVN